MTGVDHTREVTGSNPISLIFAFPRTNYAVENQSGAAIIDRIV